MTPIHVDTGVTLKEFSVKTLAGESDARVQDFQTVTSYSWLDTKQPAILVPGAPFMYKGFQGSLRVPPDSGCTFIDQASARLPDAPLLPLYAAVRHVEPQHDFGQYKLITDRGNLKKLLSWVTGDGNKDFRIDLECDGSGGLVLRRWEPEVMEKIGGFKGYRGNFEHATYQPLSKCEQMLSHSRIVSYTFAGLPILVRFEVDAFIPDEATKKELRRSQTGPKATHDLVDMLLKLDLRAASTSAAEKTKKTLRVDGYENQAVEHAQVMELKTRSIRAETDVTKLYIQTLWSQTPAVVVAKHASGKFIEEERLGLLEMQQEADLDDDVGKVATLLKEVLAILGGKEKGYKACLLKVGAD